MSSTTYQRGTETRPCGGQCGRSVMTESTWHGLDTAARRDLTARRIVRHDARGLCRRCVIRTKADGTYDDHEPRTTRRDVILEEWARMDRRPGDSMAEQCRQLAPRLSMTAKTLQRALLRAGVRNPTGNESTQHVRRSGLHRDCHQCTNLASQLSCERDELARAARKCARFPDRASYNRDLEKAREGIAKAQAWQDMHLEHDHDDTELVAA